MKTIIALTTFAIASLGEKIFKPKQLAVVTTSGASEATDETRRYDIDDLILS